MRSFGIIRKLGGHRSRLILWWLPMILVAKLIRYTLLKVTLVDASIGHYMITAIVNNRATFKLLENSGDSVHASGNASGNASYIFQLLNVFSLQTYAQFEVFITVIWNLLLLSIILNCKKNYTQLQTLFLVVSVLMLNIFDFNLAKEPIQMLYFIILFWILVSKIIGTKGKLVGTILAIILMGVTYRAYYFLILYFGAVFYLLFIIVDSKPSIKRLLIVLVLVALSYFLLLNVLKTISYGNYSELVRVRTRPSNAVTAITRIFNQDNLIVLSFEYLFAILRLLFPIELIRFGPKYIIYVISQLVVSAVFIYASLNIKKASNSEKIAYFVYAGFLLMSATFEPDFGSWVRHEAAVFPVTVLISGVIPAHFKTQNKANKSWKMT